MPTKEQIVAQARTYIGVKWQHQGRTRRGIDCGGIIACIARDLGIPLEDCHGYSRLPDGRSLQRVFRERFDQVLPSDLQAGDVVLLGADPGCPCHIALVTELAGQGLAILHASARLTDRRVVEHRLSDDWKQKIQGCFRFRGLS